MVLYKNGEATVDDKMNKRTIFTKVRYYQEADDIFLTKIVEVPIPSVEGRQPGEGLLAGLAKVR